MTSTCCCYGVIVSSPTPGAGRSRWAGSKTGESPAEAAAREFVEETGWRPGQLRPLIYVQPTPGLSSSEHHIFRADEAVYIGEATDKSESERMAWLPLSELRARIEKAEITSGTTVAALLYLLSEPSLPG